MSGIVDTNDSCAKWEVMDRTILRLHCERLDVLFLGVSPLITFSLFFKKVGDFSSGANVLIR
jgi:hypothetical protein